MSSPFCHLIIVHTNDIHSHFEQMPGIAARIKNIRNAHTAENETVIAVDCGDHMDRVHPGTEGTGGIANIAVMNATGYDLAVPGNNEGLTLTPSELAAAYGGQARFAVLASNLFSAESGTRPPWAAPYRILQANGLRIGFIGVTISYPEFYRLLGWDVRDPFAVTYELIRELRGKTDVLVVLSHLGLANDERMAMELDGIDLILGAHTHHLLAEPKRVRDTYLCAAGKFGQYVGEVNLIYDLGQKRIVAVSGLCHPVREASGDFKVAGIIADYYKLSLERLREPVGKLAEGLEIRWDGESRLGNLLAAGLRRWTGAEVGLVNAGQVLQSMLPGVITKETLLNLCPSPINPCRLLLRGGLIRQALEESLLGDFVYKAIFGYGFRGKMLGVLCLDGMEVEYDGAAEPYRKITAIRVGGLPLEDEREYSVGTIDMFTFGSGYLSLSRGRRIEYFLPELLRDVLEAQLRDTREIAVASRKRWHCRPE